MKKLKYVYLIAYTYLKGAQSGSGSMILHRNHKINTEDEVKSVQEYIKEAYDNDAVAVTNFILLNKRGK